MMRRICDWYLDHGMFPTVMAVMGGAMVLGFWLPPRPTSCLEVDIGYELIEYGAGSRSEPDEGSIQIHYDGTDGERRTDIYPPGTTVRSVGCGDRRPLGGVSVPRPDAARDDWDATR